MIDNQKIEIDWTEFREETDTTEGAQLLACSSGYCEV